jgi:hypothetical protein
MPLRISHMVSAVETKQLQLLNNEGSSHTTSVPQVCTQNFLFVEEGGLTPKTMYNLCLSLKIML